MTDSLRRALRSAVRPVLLLPLLLLVLVASAFSVNDRELNTLIPGIAGMSIMATTFNALAFNFTFRRDEGILKRVRGTPMPVASYFAGMLGSNVANAFVQMALVVVIGHLGYGVDWPHDWPAPPPSSPSGPLPGSCSRSATSAGSRREPGEAGRFREP